MPGTIVYCTGNKQRSVPRRSPSRRRLRRLFPDVRRQRRRLGVHGLLQGRQGQPRHGQQTDVAWHDVNGETLARVWLLSFACLRASSVDQSSDGYPKVRKMADKHCNHLPAFEPFPDILLCERSTRDSVCLMSWLGTAAWLSLTRPLLK